MKRALLLLVVSACTGEPNEGHRLPKLGPPPEAFAPEDLRIDVEVDGTPAEPITAERLRALPPDFSDDTRRAWKLETLAGVATLSHALAEGKDEVSVRFSSAASAVPVLVVSRRGEVVVRLLDPAAPFPAHHGQGGRLGRPVESDVRLASPRQIRLRTRAHR
jgi:hypothetical protein